MNEVRALLSLHLLYHECLEYPALANVCFLIFERKEKEGLYLMIQYYVLF